MFDFFFKKRELLPLPYKREIHCHLIPEVDDGSQSFAFSIKALRSLQDFGVERVIFTPHHTYPRFLASVDVVQSRYEELKNRAKTEGLSIDCENVSYEYRVDSALEELANAGKYGDANCKIRPLKGKYLLIENGYSLILAHPERYLYYAGMHGSHYHHLQEMNVEFQCNILSFTGYYGDVAKKMVYWMLNNGYVNYLGSDMHNEQHIKLIDKFLRSKEYAKIQSELVDSVNNDLI